jgi:tetratricopeptide (TPR) repeat protein
MTDRQIRTYLFVLLLSLIQFLLFLVEVLSPSGVSLTTWLITTLVAGLCSWAVPWVQNYVGSLFVSLTFGVSDTSSSYVKNFYPCEMEKARRFVLERRLNEAVVAYREIVQKAPDQIEARFMLADSYRKLGYVSLAMSEYHKIIHMKWGSEPCHPYVWEAQRAIKELRALFF